MRQPWTSSNTACQQDRTQRTSDTWNEGQLLKPLITYIFSNLIKGKKMPYIIFIFCTFIEPGYVKKIMLSLSYKDGCTMKF